MNTSVESYIDLPTVDYLSRLESKIPRLLDKYYSAYLLAWPLNLDIIEKAMAAGDLKGAADGLHKLGGYSGMLGLIAIHAECVNLEKHVIGQNRSENLDLCTTKLKESLIESISQLNERYPKLRLSILPAG